MTSIFILIKFDCEKRKIKKNYLNSKAFWKYSALIEPETSET